MPPKKTAQGRSLSTSADKSQDREGQQKDDNDPPAPCGTCSKPCTAEDKALECGLCNIWFHISCQDIDVTMYNVIRKDSNSPAPLLHWYCRPSCSKLATNVIDSLLKIQTEVGKLGAEVEGVKGRVQNIEEGQFTPAMQEAVRTLASNGEGAAAATPQMEKEEIMKIVDKKTKELSLETQDRARRSRNLVVFGILETATMDSQESKKENNTKADELLTEIGSTHRPTETRRLGNFVPNAPRPRPLRLSFATETARDETLHAFRRARNELRSKGDGSKPLLASASVRKDLTPNERKEEEALYRELKQKQDASKDAGDDTAKWIRKNGKVVNIGKRQPPPQGGNKEGE